MIQAQLRSEVVQSLLSALPMAIGADCPMWIVDALGIDVAVAGSRARPAVVPADHVEHRVRLGDELGSLCVVLPRSRLAIARPVIDAVARCIAERARLEGEMESVYSGSLQLLEEVAMTAEMLTQLPECTSDQQVVRVGLRALLVGASVERVAWIEFDPATGMCTPAIEMTVDPVDGSIRENTELDRTPFLPARTLLSSALRAGAEGVLEAVSADAASPIPGLHAAREMLAVPARYADGGRIAVQGILVAMDKRASSYASASRLGSQEGKMIGTVALMIASAIGNRRAAVAGQELAVARAIQQQVLPARAAVVPGFELVGRCETSGAVGGDYFDFVSMPSGRTLALVADVSGHNLASGMLMVGARAALRVIAGSANSVAAVFDDLAVALHDDLERTERFITAAGFALAPQGATIDFVGAGHPDALLLRDASGAIESIESTGAMFGFLPEQHFGCRSVAMEPGDLLVLYTDGVVETVDANEEPFGESRLCRLLAGCRGLGAQDVLDRVFDQLAAHRGTSGAPADDVTVVVLRRIRNSGEQA